MLSRVFPNDGNLQRVKGVFLLLTGTRKTEKLESAYGSDGFP